MDLACGWSATNSPVSTYPPPCLGVVRATMKVLEKQDPRPRASTQAKSDLNSASKFPQGEFDVVLVRNSNMAIFMINLNHVKLSNKGRLTDKTLCLLSDSKLVPNRWFYWTSFATASWSQRTSTSRTFKYEMLQTIQVSRSTTQSFNIAGKKLVALSDEETDVLLAHAFAMVL